VGKEGKGRGGSIVEGGGRGGGRGVGAPGAHGRVDLHRVERPAMLQGCPCAPAML
jgi:hypothetical protein